MLAITEAENEEARKAREESVRKKNEIQGKYQAIFDRIADSGKSIKKGSLAYFKAIVNGLMALLRLYRTVIIKKQ